MSLLAATELLGLVRLPSIGPRRIVREGVEKKPYVRQAQPPKDPEKRKRDRLAYIERNREKYLATRRRISKRRYWANVEKRRALARQKQRKANYTPEQWAKRMAVMKAAKVRRDADPEYRAKRLAKQRAYYYANKAKANG